MILLDKIRSLPLFRPIPEQHYRYVKKILAHELFWNTRLALAGLLSAIAIFYIILAQETGLAPWYSLLVAQFGFAIPALVYLFLGERLFPSARLQIASVFCLAAIIGSLFGSGLFMQAREITDPYRLLALFSMAIGVTGAASFTFTVSPATFLAFCVPYAFPLFAWLWFASPNESGRVLTVLAGNYFFVIFFLVLREYRRRVNLILTELELRKERERSDLLLLNILPRSVAEDLKERGKTEPQVYQSATVMFTDFVGFTRIAERMSPRELIDELDKCFSYFDQVTEKYRLEKLKTIGDSFMCAGGLPRANRTHAIDCCLAALEIRNFMEQMRGIKAAQGLDYWELRIGIHTGPLVAGVVGHRKFAYDVWGDTVNTASRLESAGIAGEINISEGTYREVRPFFACEPRGHIAAKNKGTIDMHLVKGIAPPYSQHGDGRVPNENFRNLYKSIMRGKAPSHDITLST